MSQYRIYVHQKGKLAGARERGIYVDKKGQLYQRQLLANGQEHYQSLGTNQISAARERRDSVLKKQIEAELGIAEDPAKAAKKAKTPVATVIRRYAEDGYPDKKGNPRKPGKHRDEEATRCEVLLEYFNGEAPAEDLDQDGLDAYHTWRCEKIAKGKKKLDGTKSKPKGEGDRTTDLELNCLNSAYRWAKRKKLVRTNPIFDRVRYYSPGDAVHCREYAPENADELHTAAGTLFSSRQSEPLGWQLLIEGMTGLRSAEAVSLLMNARATEPGGLTKDRKTLCVRRAKKSKKFNNCVQVHAGLELVLAAHAIWHTARFPLSAYYLPGRAKAAGKTVSAGALTKSLDRLFQKGKLPRKYTSHGAGRAFYVYARRSQGADDPQICYEINHTGGVGTLESVYALPAKHWQNGHAPGMDWLPKKKEDYAWLKMKTVDFSALDKAQETPPDFSI